MTQAKYRMSQIDGPQSSYPYDAARPTAGSIHRGGRVVAVVVVVMLIAVGIIASL